MTKHEESSEQNDSALDSLGEAFRDISNGTVEIQQKSAEAVREFLERMERAGISARRAITRNGSE